MCVCVCVCVSSLSTLPLLSLTTIIIKLMIATTIITLTIIVLINAVHHCHHYPHHLSSLFIHPGYLHQVLHDPFGDEVECVAETSFMDELSPRRDGQGKHSTPRHVHLLQTDHLDKDKRMIENFTPENCPSSTHTGDTVNSHVAGYSGEEGQSEDIRDVLYPLRDEMSLKEIKRVSNPLPWQLHHQYPPPLYHSTTPPHTVPLHHSSTHCTTHLLLHTLYYSTTPHPLYHSTTPPPTVPLTYSFTHCTTPLLLTHCTTPPLLHPLYHSPTPSHTVLLHYSSPTVPLHYSSTHCTTPLVVSCCSACIDPLLSCCTISTVLPHPTPQAVLSNQLSLKSVMSPQDMQVTCDL